MKYLLLLTLGCSTHTTSVEDMFPLYEEENDSLIISPNSKIQPHPDSKNSAEIFDKKLKAWKGINK